MIYLILGRREQGKTTLAAYLAARTAAPLVVGFDPRGLLQTNDRARNYTEIDLRFGEAEPHRAGRIIITPRAELQERFDQTCREVIDWLEAGRSSVAFIVDEARMVKTTTDDFGWLIRCVARDDLTIICTAHRPIDIPTDVRAIADCWCVFPTVQQHDLDVLEERFSPAALAAVRRLSDRQFVSWDDTKGRYRVVENASSWYVPIVSSRRALAGADLLSDLPGRQSEPLTSRVTLFGDSDASDPDRRE